MAGVASGGSGASRPYNGVSSVQEGDASEALAEWRSSEQLENGTPSTSLPFWDTDDDDEDSGLRPSKLHGKHTWHIAKFSQINKRELRSDPFEAGGYKWYILIYPQGCDVCNHLSLFLCVANHDKLLPGWSHFAQFTIAVENSDPKKSKYSDTLHRFWKKEHDWGWKKFMELSKVLDGFIKNDTLTIKAQVQVIREKADRPFRCLDRIYRKELVRVYLTNVEQICRRFVEERRSTLGKLIEDKARWSSFCAFWLGIDQKSRRSMTRERTDSILRVVVKQFFIEKEVTSTLVMDSLHSGVKALERQIKTKKSRRNLLGSEELPIPVVHIEQDMFVLVDDVLLLLERAALEPLPPKDDKGPQNRIKDGSSGDDCSNESLERDLRRLTELGRRTIEIFVLDHIFSKIEVAYQESIALKRQEELIREEAVWLETEQKSKCGAAEKEKKLKKKQGKQKRNNRKGKDKGRDDNTIGNALDKLQLETPDESQDSTARETKSKLERSDTCEDVSDVSDTVDHAAEVLLDLEYRESSPASGGGASALSPAQYGESIGSGTIVDDSSSTCSTDSVPSVVTNGFLKANYPLPNQENHRCPPREKNQQGRATSDMSGCVNEGSIRQSDVRDVGAQNGSFGSRKAESEPKAATEPLQDNLKKVEPQVVKGQLAPYRTEPSLKDQAVTRSHPIKTTVTPSPSSSISSNKHTPSSRQPKLEPNITSPPSKIAIKRPLPGAPQLAPSVTKSADVAAHKSASPPKPTEKPLTQEIPIIMSRPLSAPIVPGPRPTTPVASMVQSQPLLSRSASAVGRLGPDPTSSPHHHHQSYRNAMMGTNILAPPTSTSSGYTQPIYYGPTPADSVYPSIFPFQSPETGTVDLPSVQNDARSLDVFNQVHITPRQSHGLLSDEFPHLDIINDLLDDEYGRSTSFQSFDGGSQHLNRQFSYSGDIGMTNDVLLGPSTSSSRFQRTHSFHENGFQPSYSSFGGPFEPTRDFIPQPNMRPFLNLWQVGSSDLSYLSTRTSDRYGYHVPDYSNLAGNLNGYNVYRPSNGQ